MNGLARLVFPALLLACVACEGRPRPEGTTEAPKRFGPAVAVLDFSGGVPEQEKAGFLGAQGPRRSFDEALRVVTELAKDDETRGVMVKLGSAGIGAARAEELGEALANVRAKKKVYCHAEGLSNATMLLATQGCSSIWLAPAGEVTAIGIAAQLVYMRRLLSDELHLGIDIQQVGKYKGAEEPLTRDGPSPEAKASLLGVLTDFRAAWTESLVAARPKVMPEAFEDGPWSAPRAKDLGIVDEIGYLDDALSALRDASGGVRDRVLFGAGAEEGGDLDEVVRTLAGEGGGNGPIALVRATGSIAMTSSGNGLLGGSAGIIEKELSKTIARLEKDDDVKAVVIRIDSPGGSALASDLMWHRLMKLRKKKPLVFSVGDMAASGGYYLASSADFIFADPMSLVGSIGVVGGKIGFGDALERIGVHAEVLAASPKPGADVRAAYESPLIRWDDPTRARVLESMTGIYELFLARVSEGRSTRGRTVSRDQVDANAEGKVFSGREGKRLGLVDEIGGLAAAIAKARELAKLGENARVSVVAGKSGGFLESLDPTAATDAALAPAGALRRVAPDLVPFVSGLAPLAEGERTVVSLPYALTVR